MVGCNECKQYFYTEHALNIHKGKVHGKNQRVNVPDLIGMGVVKRKLTLTESKQITKEVCDMTDDSDLRFKMAILKAIDITS